MHAMFFVAPWNSTFLYFRSNNADLYLTTFYFYLESLLLSSKICCFYFVHTSIICVKMRKYSGTD